MVSKVKYLLLLLLSGCSSLPSMSSVSSPTSTTVPSTAVGQVMKDTTDNIWQWVLLSCVLVLFFPSMREPIRAFLSALFTVLRLPLDHVIMLYNNKYKNNAEEEERR